MWFARINNLKLLVSTVYIGIDYIIPVISWRSTRQTNINVRKMGM